MDVLNFRGRYKQMFAFCGAYSWVIFCCFYSLKIAFCLVYIHLMRNSVELGRKAASRNRFNDSKNQKKNDQLKANSFSRSDKNPLLSTTNDSITKSNLQSEYETMQLREALC